ncbi:MAG: citramalate synthase [Geminicoccaceae bacterium]|jgi:2-isopropylmalate synthase|nr:MAG: citramalate synthase [Geminicoccaceae bacterium]
MAGTRIFLYDTTLRDGAQTQGVDFSLADKRRIALQLDRLGIDWIEGGWPGANPTDERFFAEPPRLERARLAAFGMTRRAGRSAENDPGLVAVLSTGAPTVTLVGKASARQAEGALGVTREENLAMIADSIRAAARRAAEVMFDAEHFFDGFKDDPDYALAALEAAAEAGARWLVLCDTNGGTLPHEVERICERVLARFPGERLGIHAHDDTGNAVANSLAAVRAGVRQIQGTLNGLGERCGNADLVTLLPTLVLKLGYETGVSAEALQGLTQLSRTFDEALNRTPDRHRPYVGAAAFAHKAGLHASAVLRDPSFYEHVDPALVGNERDILVSDQAGRANLLARLRGMGLPVEPDPEETATLLAELKAREAQGFAYEGASASFELLVRRILDRVPDYFELLSFRVIDERRRNAKGELVTLSEATTKVRIGERRFFTVAEGNGPVNALDAALRQALAPVYPSLGHMRLLDYRVRILAPERGTAAVTRVLIESGDDEGRVWQTVGVSGNIIDASYMALHDSITWKLLVDGATPPDGTGPGA